MASVGGRRREERGACTMGGASWRPCQPDETVWVCERKEGRNGRREGPTLP